MAVSLKARVRLKWVDEQWEIAVTEFSSADMAVHLSGIRDLDWRAMVEKIEIDPDYDAKAFNAVYLDQPEKAVDLVAGKYYLDADEVGAEVAVKVTDILGNSVTVARSTEA